MWSTSASSDVEFTGNNRAGFRKSSLGVILDSQFKWQAHINNISNAVAKSVFCSLALDSVVTVKLVVRFFHEHIMSRINYVYNICDAVMYI